MPAYILRRIDPALWAQAKARAQAEGIPLRAIILQLLALYGAGAVSIRPARAATAPDTHDRAGRPSGTTADTRHHDD